MLIRDDRSGARLKISPTPDASRRAALAARAADAKSGIEIVVLDVGDIISITERFVLVSASNTRQVKTIVEEIELTIKVEEGEGPRAIEGLDDASWVLMDFGDVIVHVFLTDTRAFYDLDRLWSDAPFEDWTAPSERTGVTSA